MIAPLAKTAVDTRVVQSDLHMVATIAHLALVTATHVQATVTAMSVRRKAVTTGFPVMSVATLKTAVDTRVVQSVLHMVVQVQLPVVATVVK
jgi:hypothetical protein